MKTYLFFTLTGYSFIASLKNFPQIITTTVNFKVTPPIAVNADNKEHAMQKLEDAIGEKNAEKFFAVPYVPNPALS